MSVVITIKPKHKTGKKIVFSLLGKEVMQKKNNFQIVRKAKTGEKNSNNVLYSFWFKKDNTLQINRRNEKPN